MQIRVISYPKGDVHGATADEPSPEDIWAGQAAVMLEIGLGGTRTHNQRLKRALICIHKLLMCCPLRRSNFLLLPCLLPFAPFPQVSGAPSSLKGGILRYSYS